MRMPMMQVRTVWPTDWPSVRSSARDIAASTSDSATCVTGALRGAKLWNSRPWVIPEADVINGCPYVCGRRRALPSHQKDARTGARVTDLRRGCRWAVSQGFRNVRFTHNSGFIEIRDGSRDLEDAVVTSGRKRERDCRILQHRSRVVSDFSPDVEPAPRRMGITRDASKSRVPVALRHACAGHTVPDRPGRLS